MKWSITVSFFVIALTLSACKSDDLHFSYKMSSSSSVGAWKEYTNDYFRMHFQYPPELAMESHKATSKTRGESIILSSTGADLTTGYWIQIISFPDAPFYNPPAGMNIDEWMLQNMDSVLFDKKGYPRLISGTRSAHFSAFETIGSPQSDTFFVINHARLISITLLESDLDHSSVYNRFLDSVQLH